MDQSTKKSERITAIASTLVAVALLTAGVTAHQSSSEPDSDLAVLESDLRFQLQTGFRHDPQGGNARLATVEQVVRAWQESPQTENDRKLLASWLLEATRHSMPGSIEPLPPNPQFSITIPENDLRIAARHEETQPENILESSSRELHTPDVTQFVAPIVPGEASLPAPSVLENSPHTLVSVTEETAPFASQPLAPKVENNVQINIHELAARIAGYHDALDEVETSLLTRQRPSFERLSTHIQLLDNLTQDFQFVKLYYESLTNREKSGVLAPRSMQATLGELHRQLDRLEEDLEADFLGEFDTAQEEQIEQFRKQLNAIADRVDW